MKYPAIILILFSFHVIAFSQQPAFRKYGLNDGIPNLNNLSLGYTGDSLYFSIFPGLMYYFDGKEFTQTYFPESPCGFNKIIKLKSGDLFICASRLLYRDKKNNWHKIRKIKKINVINKTLYGVVPDTIFIYDEKTFEWKFHKKYSSNIDIAKTRLEVYYNNIEKPGLLENNKYLYDIEKDKLINKAYNLKYSGLAYDYPIFLNVNNDYIKWGFCDDLIQLPFINRNNFNIFPFLLDNETESPFSFVIENRNDKYFYTLDSTCNLNYAGSLNITNFQIVKIRQDMIFVSSLNGFYKINPFITYYTTENSGIGKNIYSIVEHNGKIWTGGYGSGFSLQNATKFIPAKKYLNYENPGLKILPGGFKKSDNESWFFKESAPSIVILKDNKLKSYQTFLNGEKKYVTGYYIDTLDSGKLAFGLSKYGLGLLDSIVNNNIYLHNISGSKGMMLKNVLTFDQDKANRVWMSMVSRGISVYDIEKDTAITYRFTQKNKLSFGAFSMLIDDYDQLWLGTIKGLYMVSNISEFDIFNDDIFKKAIHIILPNNDNDVVLAMKQTGKYIVVGNNSGLSFIPHNSYPNGLEKIEIHQLLYKEDINGAGTDQNAMFYDGKKWLWVSVQNGVLKVDINNIKLDTTSVEIELVEVKNGNTALSSYNGIITIDPVKRNLFLKFKPKDNPSFLNNIYYNYLLTNNKNDTIAYQLRKNNNTLIIDYLNPGKYNLSIEAYKNGVIKDKLLLKIIVPYTFMENPWTKPLIIILFLLAISGFIYYRKEQIKKNAIKEISLSKLENEKEKLNVQAIISSFNPHFINNSLHWVQSRYYKDKDLTVMIGRLSQNIAYIFNKTKKGIPYHKLKEELILVENYIAIQKLRFNNSFEYFSNIDINKFANINVIVMQIQIHVENAIEHGLRNRAESKFVKIDLSEDDLYYYISIIDDGTGRKRAKQIGSQGSQSGVQMLDELYSIFNANSRNQYKIKSKYYDDIFIKNNEYFGTKVVISIPKGFVFDL